MHHLLAMLALPLGLGIAALVWRARPDRPQNRRLAAMLALYAVYLGALHGIAPVIHHQQVAHVLSLIGIAAAASLLPMYFLFLATLDAPLAVPLKPRPVQVAFLAI